MPDFENAYRNYHLREFNDDVVDVLKENPIGVAYTTYEFADEEEHELWVAINLATLQWEHYLDGDLVLVEPDTIEGFTEALECCGFDDLISDLVHIGWNKFGYC